MLDKRSVIQEEPEMFALVPDHWVVKKLGYLASLKSGEGITSETIGESGKYPVYGGNGLRGYINSFTHSGDYVLIGRQGALCGNINYAHGEFWASEHAVVVTPLEECDVRWLGETLRAMDLNQYSVSAAQPGISIDRISALKIAVPPLEEQSWIANYLDRETAEIDALVAEKERMLALLEEKREALISHIVTRGLDPKAPFKPSSLDWLGNIPQHWKVRRLKFLIETLEQGSSPLASNVPAQPDELGILKLSAISKGRFIRHENKALQQADNSIQSLSLQKGDVLLTRGNTPKLVGDACVVPQDEPNLLISDLIYRIRVKETEILPKFLGQFLITPYARLQIEADARGSSGSMVKISQGHILDWLTPVPPKSDQQEIVEAIEQEHKKTQELESVLIESINLLKERRSALITAAVTGQIAPEVMTA